MREGLRYKAKLNTNHPTGAPGEWPNGTRPHLEGVFFFDPFA